MDRWGGTYRDGWMEWNGKIGINGWMSGPIGIDEEEWIGLNGWRGIDG